MSELTDLLAARLDAAKDITGPPLDNLLAITEHALMCYGDKAPYATAQALLGAIADDLGRGDELTGRIVARYMRGAVRARRYDAYMPGCPCRYCVPLRLFVYGGAKTLGLRA